MSINPNSLANLRGGSKPGHKKKMSIRFVNDFTHLITTDYPSFVEQLHSLSPKEFCETYLKLLKMVLPKQINVVTPPEYENPNWVIQLASGVTVPRFDSDNDSPND